MHNLEFLAFLCLAAANIGLVAHIVIRRGLSSCEGLGSAFLLLYLASFAVPVAFEYITPTEHSSPADIAHTIDLSLWPLTIHALAGILFFGGLQLSDRRGAFTRFQVSDRNRKMMLRLGVILALGGLIMKIAGMYIAGVRGISGYLDNLYAYDISVRKFGFLDLGVQLSAFGVALVAVLNERRPKTQFMCILLGLGIVTLLSTSKSGVFLFAFPMYFIAAACSPVTIARWKKMRYVIIACVLFVVELGVKTQVKYSGLYGIQLDPSSVVESATTIIEERASQSGLFHSYVYLVSRIEQNPSLEFRGRVFVNTFLGIIPRVFWNDVLHRNKPEHPFHAMGHLVNRDYNVDPNSNDAPTLWGACFVDWGLWGLVGYALIGGVALGLIRRLATGDIFKFLAYTYFAANFGPALAESGFLSLLYWLVQAGLLYGLTRIISMFEPKRNQIHAWGGREGSKASLSRLQPATQDHAI